MCIYLSSLSFCNLFNHVYIILLREKPDEEEPPPEPTPATADESGDQPHPTAAPHTQDNSEPAETGHQSSQAEGVAKSASEPPACESSSPDDTQQETGITSHVDNSDSTQKGSSVEGVEHQSVDESASGSVEGNSGTDVGNENSVASAAQDDQSTGQGTGVDSSPQSALEGQSGSGQAAEASSENRSKEWTWEEISKGWRKFNIDLAPKVYKMLYDIKFRSIDTGVIIEICMNVILINGLLPLGNQLVTNSYIGYQLNLGSHLKFSYSLFNVCTMWLHHIYKSC